MGLLTSTVGAAKEMLGVERIEAVADMGYHKVEDIETCEAAGITPYIYRPRGGTAVANGRFLHGAVPLRWPSRCEPLSR